jgi:hypothetical protein
MWSPGMGIILSYFLLFAMFMNWVSGDCYLYIIHVLQKGNTKMLMPLSTIFQLNMWWSVLFVEETGVPGENKRPAANH